MKKIVLFLVTLLTLMACKHQQQQPEREAGFIVQISLGDWYSPDYTAEQIINRLDTVSKLIPIEKVIIGWSDNKDIYRQVGEYLHGRNIHMLLWLPVFAETEGVCDNKPAVDLWGKQPVTYEKAAGDGFRFTCPTDPQNITNVIALYDRMFSDCGFDGVFLDRIRTQSFVTGVSGVLGCGCPVCVERFAAEGVDIQSVKAEFESKGDAFFSVKGYSTADGFVFENPLAEKFFKAKGHVVSNSVAAVADSLHNRGLEVGMDLFAPFLAPFVGQDYAILTSHADFIKPMLYRACRAPAGTGYEYNQLRKSIPGATGYPHFRFDTDFLKSQVRIMQSYSCGKYPGIEINYDDDILPITDHYVHESLEAIQDCDIDGVVYAWNIMEAPLSHFVK